ncbi:MAG: hypothetical protein ACP5D2_02630 [Candidatus Nanoarchaeia archaeon]
MEKSSKLKPSQRDKRRYLVINAKNEDIEQAILRYIGELGFAKADYRMVKKGKKTIGSCLASKLDDVRAALSLADISIEKVSGTLKGLKR